MALIANNFSKLIGKKITKAYESYMLNPLIEPLLEKIEICLKELKDDEKKNLYRLIGEGNEEGIIELLENFVETEENS